MSITSEDCYMMRRAIYVDRKRRRVLVPEDLATEAGVGPELTEVPDIVEWCDDHDLLASYRSGGVDVGSWRIRWMGVPWAVGSQHTTSYGIDGQQEIVRTVICLSGLWRRIAASPITTDEGPINGWLVLYDKQARTHSVRQRNKTIILWLDGDNRYRYNVVWPCETRAEAAAKRDDLNDHIYRTTDYGTRDAGINPEPVEYVDTHCMICGDPIRARSRWSFCASCRDSDAVQCDYASETYTTPVLGEQIGGK